MVLANVLKSKLGKKHSIVNGRTQNLKYRFYNFHTKNSLLNSVITPPIKLK